MMLGGDAVRRVFAVILTIASVVAGVVVIVALTRASNRTPAQTAAKGVAQTRAGSVNIVRYQRFGGSSTACGGSDVATQVPRFTLPGSASQYSMTLTVSLRYRTYGKGATFSVAPHVAAPFAPYPPAQPTMQPTNRPLLPTGGQLNTATFVTQVSAVFGAHEYRMYLEPAARLPGGFCLTSSGDVVRAGIRLTQVVYSVQAWSR